MISVVIISKDEASLDDTLTDVASQVSSLMEPCEVVVVDASSHRLDYIRRRHETMVRWLEFEQPPGVRVSIPHQRNVGVREARGEIIVFTDAGCHPRPGWLACLVAPLRKDESVVCGVWKDPSGKGRWEVAPDDHLRAGTYVHEAATLNFAFRREVFDAAGGFDENFAYGSDMDFCWRLTDVGYRIRCVPDAIIEHDWGTPRRNRRRSYTYGKARAHLYRKHRGQLKHMPRNDPMCVIYPLFLLGLPFTLIFPLYPLLLLIPAWRYRSRGIAGVLQVLAEHLLYGAGFLVGVAAQ